MAPTSKVDIEKFDGKNDFGLWKMKMLAHLGNMGFAKALEGADKLPASLTEEKKTEILDKAYNTLILSLNDKVLREVVKCKSAADIWLKLEALYMTKNLSNRLYLKAKFFTFKMAEGKDLQGHIDEFNKLIVDLENIEVEYEDEDKALVLLHSLPKSYETFVDILKHGRETISLDDVVGALRSKELQKKIQVKESSGDGLVVRGRSDKKEFKGRSGRSKSRDGKRSFKCYTCHEEGHMKRDCPKRNGTNGNNKGGDAAIAQADKGYESAEVLVVTTKHSDRQWIMDSGCSFHMTPNRGWFETFEENIGGDVLLGNNRPCKVIGIGTVRIKTHDGVEHILSEVRYVPDLKRNLISLGALDERGYS